MNHLRAGQMQYANNKMEPDRALVSTIIMEIHMKVADRNVSIVQIVQQIKPVLGINALILALECVG